MNWDEDFGQAEIIHTYYDEQAIKSFFAHLREVAASTKDFSLSDKEFLKQCGIAQE